MWNLVALLVLATIADCNVIPKPVYDPCSRSDPNLNQCLLQALEKSRPYLYKGVPEIKVPVLEPFEREELIVDQRVSDILWAKATINNIKVHGISSVIFENVKVNVEKLQGEIELTVPNVNIQAEYDIKGQLLTVPMQGRGFFKGNISDIKIVGKTRAKKFEKNGIEYLKLDKPELFMTIGNGVIQMTSKNPQLQFAADLIVNSFNENPKRVFDSIVPIAIRVGTSHVTQIIDNSLSLVPFKEMLVD